MLLVDDYNLMMWVYMLKTKDEALTYFKKFKLLFENGAKQGIQVLRTDRGGEFCSNEFQNFCDEQGILRHFTAPYKPQQNCVVEHRNRMVVAIKRSMLNERNMSAQYWGEAVRYAVYVLNKLPTISLSELTSYEAWFERNPSVDYLKIFGCLAYVKIHDPHTRKLDARSKEMIHLGREPGTKVYRLFDPASGTIHISRDLTFDERKGWDLTKSVDTVRNIPDSLTVEGYNMDFIDNLTQTVTAEPTTPTTPGTPENSTTTTPISANTKSSVTSELSD